MKLFHRNPLKLAALLCSIAMTITFIGCEHDVYDPNNKDKGETPNPFEFSTTSDIQVNVKYDVPEGYKILFEVYLENPFTTNEEGQTVKRTGISPVITRMTDGNGTYNGKETITTDHGNEAYIYTSYIGVPGLFKAEIKDNAIHADINMESANKSLVQTRAGVTGDIPGEYKYLGTWNENGRPEYLDSEGSLDISSDVMDLINSTLPEGGKCPKKYRQSVDFIVNDPKGRDVEVSVRFIGGTSSAASTFGYYCYRDGDSKKEIEAAARYVIFPNTLTSNVQGKAIALKRGDCVKLHYFDENGIDKGTVFPNGVRIGWFLLNNAFYKNYKAVFSTPELNNKKIQYTAAFRIKDFIVLSFEDWDKEGDFNDVMFNVLANPIEAITPDIPDVKPDEGGNAETDVAYTMNYKGIVAFEDNWPHKGDYDLNDVIVKYNSTLSFNTANKVLFTEDTFTALWCGASYKDGFAYQLNTERDNVKTEILESASTFTGQGLDDALSQATINVLLDTKSVTNNNTRTGVYKFKNTFTTPVDHATFGVAPYNPFLIAHDNLGTDRTEVHLINHKPTEKADMNLFHTQKDLSDINAGIYYVAAENYPFAIHLIDATDFKTKEKEAIDVTFPDFSKWAKSNGTEHKDWYK